MHGQGENAGQGGAGAVLVGVDAAEAGGAHPGGYWQLVEDAVGQEGDVDAVQHAGEPVHHAGQPGDNGGELVQRSAVCHGVPAE